MLKFSKLVAVATIVFLGACESKLSEEDGNDSAAIANVQVSAEGKSEDGKISVKAPGLDLALSIPKEMAREARADDDNKLLYPGAALRGMHIATGDGGGEGGNTEVEMRFASEDPPSRLVAWYRDPARSSGFALRRVEPEGSGYLVEGVQKGDEHPFSVHLAGRDGGGTDGRLVIRHRD